METRAHFVLIGAFTLAAMAGGLLFIFWLAKFSQQEYTFYDVIFDEPVTGLTRGGAVQYNGIQIGDVSSLRLAPNDPGRVIARIQVVSDTPVKTDTRAQLGFMGLTGVSFIQLRGGSATSPLLTPREGEDVAVLHADVSGLQQLIESGGDVFAKINELVLRVNRVFADENIMLLSASMSHIEQLTAALAGERDHFREIMTGLAAAGSRLDTLFQHFDEAALQVRRSAAGVGDAVERDLPGLLTEARGTATELHRFSRELADWLEHSRPHFERFAARGLDEVTATMVAIQQLAAALENLARRLEDSPAGALFSGAQGREYRGEGDR